MLRPVLLIYRYLHREKKSYEFNEMDVAGGLCRASIVSTNKNIDTDAAALAKFRCFVIYITLIEFRM